VKVLYFAWVRERVGKGEETIDLPDGVATVADLIAHLKGRGEEYVHAFENATVIRAALDQVHARHDAPLAGVSTVAFFPPMTGG
jgi:molybdopterin synthase sulfur carrier subunit